MGKTQSKPQRTLQSRKKSFIRSRYSTFVPFTLHLDESTSTITDILHEPRTSIEPRSSTDTETSPVLRPVHRANPPNYIFPVNESEAGLMTARHYLYREIWGGNFAAPVAKILRSSRARVLDVGCGPGTWTCENACEFPNARFTGVDIVPIFPKDVKPINAEFITMDILEGFPMIPDNTYDFVYVRNMMFVLTIRDWPKFINELVRITKPGGYVEIADNDLVWYNEGLLTADLRTRVNEILRAKRSIEPIISKFLPGMMKATNLLPIVHGEEKTVPIGSWGGNIGKLNFEVYKWGSAYLAETVASDLCLRESEYLDLLEDGFKEIDAGQVYHKVFRFWAKKTRVEDLLFASF